MPKTPKPKKACECGKTFDGPNNRPNHLKTHLEVDHGRCRNCDNKIVARRHHKKEFPEHNINPMPRPRQAVIATDDGTIAATSSQQERSQRHIAIRWCLTRSSDEYVRTPDEAYVVTLDQLPNNKAEEHGWLAELKTNFQNWKSDSWALCDKTYRPPLYHIHQSLVTGLYVKHGLPKQVTLQRWPEVEGLLEGNSLLRSEYFQEHLHEVVLVLPDTSTPDEAVVNKRYKLIGKFNNIISDPSGKSHTVRAYPNWEEAEADNHKIPDIKMLDYVAKELGDWRPLTCFGDKACSLEKHERTIIKRSWSGSSNHIRDYWHSCPPPEAKHLTCRGQAHETAEKEQAHWFHQELVESLKSFEMRIFIVTYADPNGIRGLKGRILQEVCTTEKEGVWTVSGQIPENLSVPDVHSFALAHFEAIRNRNDRQYESLEVGCRMDIGVAPKGEEGFFVNELTRWYGAHFFSNQCLAYPHTKISIEFGKAFVRYFQNKQQHQEEQ